MTARATADLACSPPAADASPDAFTGCVSTAQEQDQECPFDADSGLADVHSAAVLFRVTPGSTYQFSYDELLPISLGSPVTVDVYGALAPCGRDEKLFTLTLDGRWHQSYCFTPTIAFTYSTAVVHDSGTLYNFKLMESGTDCSSCTDGTTQ